MREVSSGGALPPNAEILLHTAVVYAAIGRVDDAGKMLKAAAAVDSAMKDRPEYKETERKISRVP